ncbi:unnamed protein product [Toxocara canis]|uniref:Rap-GAP domain-containing protein n=1 Tax=Toxocara canis TaxID=6265 RepID=A0A183TUZ2_TOXCA|nr:unnamed protein product [Toxocara canis]
MTDMELRAFEAHLDIMVDQIGEESTELIIERPRYAHAVMVLTNGDEPGELLTASRIKVLDPIFIPIETASNGHQVFHQYCSESERPVSSKVDAQREDDDIERALQRLEKSRNMLDEPAQTKSNVGICSADLTFRKIVERTKRVR